MPKVPHDFQKAKQRVGAPKRHIATNATNLEYKSRPLRIREQLLPPAAGDATSGARRPRTLAVLLKQRTHFRPSVRKGD